MSLYDSIAELYDPWSVSVTEDVAFYVEEAERAGSPVVELAVGTGRIAVPIARAGVNVIGVDASPGMLAIARAAAAAAGRERATRPAPGRARGTRRSRSRSRSSPAPSAHTCTCSTTTRGCVRWARRGLLLPRGRLVFDVFAPSASDIADTHGRWLEREPGSSSAPSGTRRRDADACRSAARAARRASCSRLSNAEWRAARQAGFRSSAATAGSTAARTRVARIRSGSRVSPARPAQPGRRRRPRRTRRSAPASRACPGALREARRAARPCGGRGRRSS